MTVRIERVTVSGSFGTSITGKPILSLSFYRGEEFATDAEAYAVARRCASDYGAANVMLLWSDGKTRTVAEIGGAE